MELEREGRGERRDTAWVVEYGAVGAHWDEGAVVVSEGERRYPAKFS